MKHDVPEDEKNLFREHMRDVTPLSNIKKREPKRPAPSLTIHKKNTISDAPLPTYYLSNYYHDTVEAHTVLTYTRHGIPKKRLHDIKTGQVHYDAQLDLHGLNIDDARDALCQFIHQQHTLNHRYLLIIHGKGGRQAGEAPVLKNLVNHWLKQLPDVLAFHSALSKHGGTGAVYVLLKRQRGIA